MSGAISGLLVLGLGGRILMRALAFTLEEGPAFTIVGSLEVLALGTIWGALTAPLLVLIRRCATARTRTAGLLHGVAVLALAIVTSLLVTGGGDIVAPRLFIVLGAILFSLLFLAHGVKVAALSARWSASAGDAAQDADWRHE